MAASCNDEMVVKHQPKVIRRYAQILRHGNIGVRWRRIPGGMIMHHNESLGTKFERSLHHFTEITGA